MTVDLHTPQMQEYFKIPFDNLHSFASLINYLKRKHPEILQNLVLVSPDLGGAKIVESLAKHFKKRGIQTRIALGHKTRERENEVAKVVIIGDVEGRDCLIVDDIIDTGNTLVKTAEKLREKGARRIFAYGTHGLFSEGTEKFNGFDKVLISDTLKSDLPGNFEIVSLVRLFGEAIYRTATGQSLSVLFDDEKNKESLENYDI